MVTQIQAHKHAILCMTLLHGPPPKVETEPETDPDISQEEQDEESRNSRASRGTDRYRPTNQTPPETPKSYLVTGSIDKTLKVWDLETFECITTLRGHTGKVKCVVVLENITASMIEGFGGNKRMSGMCEVVGEKGTVVREAKGDTNDADPNGGENNTNESSNDDNDNNNYDNSSKDSNDNNEFDDADTTNNAQTLTTNNLTPNPSDNNSALPFLRPAHDTSPPLFCSGGSDGLLIVWSIRGQEFQIQRQENAHLNCLLQVQNYLITGSDAKYVLVYDLLSLSYKTLLSCHRDAVRCLMKVTENFFLSGSLDGIIRMWDVNSFLPVVTLENPKRYMEVSDDHKFYCCPVVSVAPLFDGYFVAAIGKGFKIFDASSKTCVEEVTKVHKSVIVEVMPLMGGLEFVTSSEDSTIKIWSVVSVPQKHQIVPGGVAGGLSGDQFCVRLKTQLVKHQMAVRKLCAFSELSFASGGADNKIYLWCHSGVTSPKSFQRRSTMVNNRSSYTGRKESMRGKKDYVVKKYNSFRVFEDYEPDEFHAVSVAFEKYSVSETILDYVKGLVYDREVC